MKHIYAFCIAIVLFGTKAWAQPVSAYTNFQNQFMVWDNGIERKIESLLPVRYEIGRVAVPYLDNTRNFKIYSKGGVQLINQGFTSDFKVTDNLVAYRNNNALFVWENGTTTRLSNYISTYTVGDSVVLFFDNVRSVYKAYYGGNLYEIESFLGGGNNMTVDSNAVNDGLSIADGQLPSVKVSDNIAAFITYANRFKVFYHGETTELETFTVTSFDVGRNIVAYVDANRNFKVFYNGEVNEIESFTPASYKAGDNVMAYISNDGNFKIFYNGEVNTVGYFSPEYKVGDNIVAYKDASGYFKVFYKGKIYTLDAYYPQSYKISYNSLAYVNAAGMLRLFSEGEVYDVTNASTADWRLDYDVIQYRFGQNMYKIFYKGKTH
ncbi:hypothetical protein DBR32_11065 [Taibaiella sp. KBW10]|uniref:hypothetical protein n=1 Tax=Taibaiella sp. KBW10 TaxID=2153357 RepID=UPI000F5A40AA|nr:hypothetical protein [Taibaiella sp. KBW10]RQO30119.1 hypothetical protein DBR32_11065 [Taibaiella sp. KBW10]